MKPGRFLLSLLFCSLLLREGGAERIRELRGAHISGSFGWKDEKCARAFFSYSGGVVRSMVRIFLSGGDPFSGHLFFFFLDDDVLF